MGQAQSQTNLPAGASAQRRPEAFEDPEIVAQRNKEERAKRAAAAEARFNSTTKPNSGLARKLAAQKKKSTLQQASDENRGWRAADEMRDVRSFN
ncbi:hypothetical protein HYFRA_00012068 [Hymenoscyphus fraxineus]|uniref:Uncharacterized protein n=1 Tax=Hymenoscyphus fraxineus TaxID=746836 RepID=A0A9N9PQU3_9HELO|nr:hypothetical protein HYFRA_00012068 [Hymenoscyphus fraxineus]